jgi:hypothetical protein
MTPAEPASVVTTAGLIPTLVDADQGQRAQPGRAPSRPGPRPDRPAPTRYALRGLLLCGQCGRLMQGNTVRRYSGKHVFHYRCTYRTEYPGDEGHWSARVPARAREVFAYTSQSPGRRA